MEEKQVAAVSTCNLLGQKVSRPIEVAAVAQAHRLDQKTNSAKLSRGKNRAWQ